MLNSMQLNYHNPYWILFLTQMLIIIKPETPQNIPLLIEEKQPIQVKMLDPHVEI